MEIMFSTEKHKEFFISMITKVNTWDRYHMALFYTLGISPGCRKHIEDLFTFTGKNYGIKPETALLHDWQTDGSRTCTRLGYNLFNGFIDRKTDPGSLFACKYAPYFLEAIKLRYPNLFKKKIYCVKDAEGNVVKESIDSLGLAKIYVGTYKNKYQKNYTAEPQEPVHTDIDI